MHALFDRTDKLKDELETKIAELKTEIAEVQTFGKTITALESLWCWQLVLWWITPLW